MRYTGFSASPRWINGSEYFDYTERPVQIITEELIVGCCEAVIRDG